MNVINKSVVNFFNKILPRYGLYILRTKKDFHYVPIIYGKAFFKLKDIRDDDYFKRKANIVGENQRSLLHYGKLHILYEALLNAARNANNEIVMAEAGVYRGGSSYFMADIAGELAGDRRAVRMYSVDTFEGHSEKDFLSKEMEGDNSVGLFSTTTSYDQVNKYLSCFPFVKVIKGRLQDSTKSFENEKFTLVHLDMDLYVPTIFALNFFGERMVSGGIIVMDDYKFITAPGIEKAVNEYIAKCPRKVTLFGLDTGQSILSFI